MILVRMQCSLNKDHQHHRWQPQRSWTFYQGFQDVQDKQLMQLSAKTQVKMEKGAPTFLKMPKSGCPDIWTRLPKHKWTKSWSCIGRPSRSSWTKFVRSSFGKTLWERQFEKVLFSTVGTQFRMVNVSSLTEKKDYSYLCMWTISNWQARLQT